MFIRVYLPSNAILSQLCLFEKSYQYKSQ